MTNLETILFSKEQVKEIALSLKQQKNLSQESISDFISSLRNSPKYISFIDTIHASLLAASSIDEQSKIRGYLFSSIEFKLGTKFPELKNEFKELVKKQENLSYLQFKQKLAEPLAEFIHVAYLNFRRLRQIQDIMSLNGAQFDELEKVRVIFNNIGYIGSIHEGKFLTSEKQECKKAVCGLIDYFLDDYLTKRNNDTKKLVIKKFVNMLNQSGLEVKLTSKGIGRKSINEYLDSLKKQRIEEVRTYCHSSNVNVYPLDEGAYELVFDGKPKNGGKLLDPYAIGQEFLIDFLKFGEKTLTTDRQKDAIAIAKQMILDKKFPGYGKVIGVLSKDKKIVLDLRAEYLKHAKMAGEEHSDRFNIFSKTMITGVGILDNYKFITEDMQKNGLYTVCRDILVEDLLDGVGLLGQDFRNIYNDYTLFWTKFKPQEFDLRGLFSIAKIPKIEDSYQFKIAQDSSSLWKAVCASGACLTKQDVNTFTSDPTTLNILGYKNNQPIGYTRMFLTKDHLNEPGLAIDTIEIGNKEFIENGDWVRAMTLAANQLCLDTNQKFVVGTDARVRYGPRQGFSSKRILVELTKLGEVDLRLYNPRSYTAPYTFSFDSLTGKTDKTEAFLLMQNWRRN